MPARPRNPPKAGILSANDDGLPGPGRRYRRREPEAATEATSSPPARAAGARVRTGADRATVPARGASRACCGCTGCSRPSAAVDRQALFIAAVSRGRKGYAEGANDMAKGAARPLRAKEICSALTGPKVDRWTGKVVTLSSNGDGLGVLAIKMDDDVTIKTWNNAVSDVGDHTLINPGSPVFQKASTLKVGQRVAFSGSFIPAKSIAFVKGASPWADLCKIRNLSSGSAISIRLSNGSKLIPSEGAVFEGLRRCVSTATRQAGLSIR